MSLKKTLNKEATDGDASNRISVINLISMKTLGRIKMRMNSLVQLGQTKEVSRHATSH